MKNKILLTLALASILFVKNLNSQSFDKADDVIAFGLGIGGNYGVSSDGYTSQTPAIGVMYEKGMRWSAGPGIIGLGGYLGFKSLRYKKTTPAYSYDMKWSYTILGIRGAYHYEFLENFDTYAGLMLGYNIESFSDKTYSNDGIPYDYNGDTDSGLHLTLFIGGRYYFSDQWAAFAELGYGIATLQIGAAYKF